MESANYYSDIFKLSRINARTQFDEYCFHSDIGNAEGYGIRLTTQSNGEELVFWIPELEWCAWLNSILSVSGIEQIDPELYPVLANWTLDPFNEWLQSKEMDGFKPVKAEPGKAQNLCWRLTLSIGTLRLPIYCEQVSDDWLREVLNRFHPSDKCIYEFQIFLGWCVLSNLEAADVLIGDAIPIIGAGENLDEFWIGLDEIEKKVFINDINSLVVKNSCLPLNIEKDNIFRVEIGTAKMSASDISKITSESDELLMPYIYTNAAIYLMKNRSMFAWGELVKFDNGFAIRIDGKSSK